MDRAFDIVARDFEIAIEQRLDLRQFRERIPVVAVRTQVRKRGETVRIEVIGLFIADTAEGSHKLVISGVRPGTGRHVGFAHGFLCVIAGTRREPGRTHRVVRKNRPVGRIQRCRRGQQLGIVRIALEEAVQQQHVGRRPGPDGLRVVLVENGAGQILGKPVRCGGHHRRASAQQQTGERKQQSAALSFSNNRSHATKDPAQANRFRLTDLRPPIMWNRPQFWNRAAARGTMFSRSFP